MENLFLEILRILDLRYHEDKTEYYLIPYNYLKLVLLNSVTEESLDNMVRNLNLKKKSLFLVSKLEDDTIDKKYFDESNSYFYKSRDIIFLICIFIKYFIKQTRDLDYEIERIFFGNNVSKNVIDKFIYILDEFKNQSYLNIFNNKKFFKKEKLNSNIDKDLDSSISISLNLYLNYNLFTTGIKKSLDYKFDVSVLYVILSLISNNLDKIKTSEIYLSLGN